MYEYGRFNYNVTNLYAETPLRASDHDPIIVGFDSGPARAAITATTRPVARGRDAAIDVVVESAPGATGGTRPMVGVTVDAPDCPMPGRRARSPCPTAPGCGSAGAR